MESEINREEILSDDVIQAFKDLTAEAKNSAEELDILIAKGREHQKVLGDTKSTRKLTEETDKLLKEQKELVKVQDNITKTLTKSSQASEKNTQQLQKQATASKTVTNETNKTAKSVEAADTATGGYIGKLKMLGQTLGVIAKSPFILVLTAIVGVLIAAGSAMKTFFASTGEGEDVLERQTSVWNQFFNTLKVGWSDLGKAVSEFFGEGSSKGIINALISGLELALPFLTSTLEKIRADFNLTADEAVALTNKLDELADRQIQNIITKATTESKYNKMILDSQDEINKSDKQRLDILVEAVSLKEKQLRIDLDIAKGNADAVLLGIGLEHSLTEAQTRRLTQTERNAKFTEEENRMIAESIAKVIDLESNYYQEVKKNAAKIIGLKQQIHKKEVDDLLKRAEKEAQTASDILENAIQNVRKEVIEGNKLKDDGDKEILELKKRNAAQLVQIQIQSLERILSLDVLNAEERMAVEQKIHDFKIKLNEALYDQVVEIKDVEVKVTTDKLADISALYQEFTGGLTNLFNSFTENRLANLDREQKAVEENTARELEMAGDNDKRKKEIQDAADKRLRDIERKRIQEQRKAAIFDKAVSLVQAGVNTALAVTNQLSKGDPYTAFARAIAAGVAGGLQVLAIASKQIPGYWRGTGPDGTTSETFIAGEKGSELMRTPGGKIELSPSTATVMRRPIGTQIFPHEQTAAMLAMRGTLSDDPSRPVSQDSTLMNLIIRNQQSLEHTIKTKKETHYNWTRKGLERAFKNGESIRYFMDNFYN
jgi:hypothetical protein